MSQNPTTLNDIINPSAEVRAARNKKAARQLATYVAVRVGVAVASAVIVNHINKKMDDAESE